MKRNKRFILRPIALGVAIAAILAPVAQAKPTPNRQHLPPPVEVVSSVELGPGEIPYVKHGTLRVGPGEIPYVDDGTTTPPAKQTPPTTSDGGSDVTFGIVSSAVIVFLLAGGLAVVAIRQSRKTRLSPA
jgi:hypothetical protein